MHTSGWTCSKVHRLHWSKDYWGENCAVSVSFVSEVGCKASSCTRSPLLLIPLLYSALVLCHLTTSKRCRADSGRVSSLSPAFHRIRLQSFCITEFFQNKSKWSPKWRGCFTQMTKNNPYLSHRNSRGDSFTFVHFTPVQLKLMAFCLWCAAGPNALEDFKSRTNGRDSS